MEAKELLILGLLSYESPAYWKFCNKCIQSTVSPNTIIRYFIGLDRVKKEKVKTLHSCLPNLTTGDVTIKPPKRKETIHEKRVRIGRLYNNLFSAMPRDSKYMFLLDGDIAMVQSNWDEVLIRELDEKYVVIGHEYSSRWPEKYQGFPCLQCSLFDAERILKLNMDFAGHGKPFKVKNKKYSKIFGLPMGADLNRDIGWEWPLRIKEAGYDGKILTFLPGDHKLSQVLRPKSKEDTKLYKQNVKSGIKGLFEFHWQGRVVGTHLTKSTCLEFDKHPICKYWVAKVEKHLR